MCGREQFGSLPRPSVFYFLCKLFKQIGVSASTGKNYFCIRHFVNKQPIGLNMAFPESFPLARQPMESRRLRKYLASAKNIYDVI